MSEELEELYKSLMSNDMKPEDITAYEPLCTLHNNIRKLKEEQEQSRTGNLRFDAHQLCGNCRNVHKSRENRQLDAPS